MPKAKSHSKNTERQISELVDLLFEDNALTAEDKERLRQWLAGEDKSGLKDEALERVFRQTYQIEEPDAFAYRMWEQFAERMNFDAKPTDSKTDSAAEKPNLRKVIRIPFHRRMAFRVAAVLAPLLVAGGALLYMNRNTSADPAPGEAQPAQTITVTGQPVTTDGGGDTEATLPDSSRIILTTGSTLTYASNFTENREVYIDGEAFFSVTHLEGKPFRVISNSITVTVHGTEFKVKAYNNDPTAEVKLASGSVAVNAEGIEETMMAPGQHFVYDKLHNTISLDEIGEAELHRIRGMNLSMDGNTLDEAFQAMANYFGIQFRVPESMDLSERGAIDLEDDITLEQALTLIRMTATTPFDFTIENDTVTITRRK